jgi:CshA-type fibril repeat protein
MKKNLFYSVIVVTLLSFPNKSFSQTPNGTANLGILESFGAYTREGGITNGAGASFIGDVGANIGVISGFGAPPAFIGNTYNGNAVTDQAKFDLLRLYIHLNALFVDYPAIHAPAFGGGETITPGVYSIPSAGSIGGNLTLDGGDNPNAFFIIKWGGALTAGAGTTIILTGGTESCNVFFMADGAITIAANANIKGTLFAKVGAVGIGADTVLEGRMFSMEGAITTGAGAAVSLPPGICTIPIFCESDCSPAPSVDVLGVLSNYAVFTSVGAVSNTSTSGINGKIGTDIGASSGYEASIVIGSFETANAATAQAKLDLDNAYIALMALPNTITDHAAAFGIGETINAGVYFINGAGSLGGTITLDAQNNPNAIFVFKFAGAFGVAAQSKIILANGARRCNVFWIGGAGVATGAVSIAAASDLKGTFLSHGGACTSGDGLFLSGRLLSTGGAATTYAGIVYNSPECVVSRSLRLTAITETTDAITGSTGGSTPALTNNDMVGGIAVVIGTAAGNVTMTTSGTLQAGLSVDIATGIVTVAPNTPSGSYPITYTICEVSNPTNCSTVTSTVIVNDAPVAINDTVTANVDTVATFNVTTNDTDVDGTIDVATVDLDPATAGIQTTFTVASEGTYTVDNLGVVTFTPVANFNGTATPVNYTVNDNRGATSNISTINVTVLSAFCVKPGITTGTALKSQVIISTMNTSPTDLPVNNGYMVLESKTKGMVITRMTTANLPTGANAIKGMLVYDTVVNCLKMYDGTAWGRLVQTCPD